MTQQASSQTAADMVLQTALQMEDIGRDFYEAFASATCDLKVRQLCLQLATAEQKHHKVFEKMRSDLASHGKTILLRDDQCAEARQKARQAVMPDPAVVRKMAIKGDIGALFSIATQMEQDAIQFYSSFIDSVPDREVLETIINEEKGHLRLLQSAASAWPG